MVNGGKPQKALDGDAYGDVTKTAAGPFSPFVRASRPIAERPDLFPLTWNRASENGTCSGPWSDAS